MILHIVMDYAIRMFGYKAESFSKPMWNFHSQ